MDKKMMFAIFLLGILAIGAVSAADGVTDDIANSDEADSVDLKTQNVEDSDLLGICGDDLLGKDWNVTGNTFKDIQDAIRSAKDGDTLYLEGHTYYGDGSEIDLSKSLKIIGQKGTVLDAQGKSRIFYVTEFANNVIMQDISFINANNANNYGGAGGAIRWYGAGGQLSGCNFINNSAVGFGGAIDWEGTGGRVSGCKFTSNSADFCGAIDWSGADGIVSGCNFTSNSANGSGAIGWKGAKGQVSGCNFINNTAKLSSGAFGGMAEGVSVSHSSFVNNRASYGGAIGWNRYSNGVVSYCTFIDNTVSEQCSAILVQQCNLKVSNSDFKCKPILSGRDEDLSLTLTLVDDLNYEDLLYSYMGSIEKVSLGYWNGSAYASNIPKSTVYPIANQNVTLEVYDSNKALADKIIGLTDSSGKIRYDYMALPGGNYTYRAYYMDSSSISIQAEGNFEVKKVSGNAFEDIINAIADAKEGDTLYLERHTYYGNGTQIELTKSIKLIGGNGTVLDGEGKSIIIYINQANDVTVENITFINGNYFNAGGAILVRGNNVHISNCIFMNNHAANYAGAISWTQGSGGVVYNCSFVNNTAKNGGAIGLFALKTLITNCNFADNHATEKANAIFLYGKNTILNSTFKENPNIGASSGVSPLKLVIGCFIDYGNDIFEYTSGDMIAGNLSYWNGLEYVCCDDIPNLAMPDQSVTLEIYDSSGNLVDNVTDLTDDDGKFVYDYAKFSNGDYNFTAYYSNLPSIKTEGSFSRIRNGTNLTISVSSVSYGKYPVVNITTNAIGNVTLTVAGKKYPAVVFTEAGSKIINVKELLDAKNNYVAKVSFGGNDYYDSATNQTKFNVKKASSKIALNESQDKNVVTLTARITPLNSGGKVTFNVNGTDYAADVENGIASVNVSDLKSGSYLVKATYGGDSNHASSSGNLNIDVREYYYILKARDVDKYFKGPQKFTVTLSDNEGNLIGGVYVKITVDGNASRAKTNKQGKASINLDFAPGYYSIVSEYENAKITSNVNVKSTIISDDVNGTYGNTFFVARFLDSSGKALNGTEVLINVNSTDYTQITDSDGYVNLSIGLNAGNYVAVSTNPINGEVKSNMISISKAPSKIALNESTDNNHVTLTARITPSNIGGKVTFNVNGTDYAADVENGVASVNVSNLKSGRYFAKATYSGDANYYSSSDDTIFDFEASYLLSASDVVKYFKGPERFTVNLSDGIGNPIANASVNITINGNTYVRITDADGLASMALNLNSGVYSVVSQYNETAVNSTVTIKATVSGENITKIFRNGTQYYATFTDTSGKTLAENTAVEFNINGVFYKRYVNENGTACMNINLNPGMYIITATNPNSTEMYTNVVTVLPSIVENYNLTKYYRNASQYSIRILDDEGNPVGEGVKVTFNINGVFYDRYSNASGHVNMNINLEPGEYIITAEYNGLRASNTIKVLSVLETHDLSMKYKDGSKFEAKVLDGQGNANPGVNVTFNINGVFYERTTDDEGIARLSINLMAGEYIITSTYNGLNAANKVTISS